MLDDDALDRLSAWLRAEGGAAVASEIVAEDHPARLWDETPHGFDADHVDALVRLLGNGGHLPLLGSIVLAVQARGGSAPPADAALALASALREFDARATRSQSSADASSADVFLCYAHEDHARIEPLVRVLRQAGLSLFRDTDSIRPGESIVASVSRAAATCRVAVVVVSAASAASTWVGREVALLLAGRSSTTRTILPIVIDDIPLPAALRDVFAIDLRGLTRSTPEETVQLRMRPLIDRIVGERHGA